MHLNTHLIPFLPDQKEKYRACGVLLKCKHTETKLLTLVTSLYRVVHKKRNLILPLVRGLLC